MSARIKAGKMRFRVDVMDDTVARDNFGGEERSNITLYTTNAAIIPLGSKERLNGVQTQGYATHRIIMRYNKTYPLKSSYRLSFDGRIFEIIDIADNDNLHKKYVLLVKEAIA